MSLIAWNDTLSVGVREIDEQHRKLVQLINGLHDHMVAGDAREIMGKVLERIVQYTAFHFETEEKLMQQHAYTLSPAHVREHKNLVQTALALQSKFANGQTSITMETMTFLRDWLQHHILESDKALGRFLATQGVR